MDLNQYMKNLTPPTGMVDVVLDTDTYNEIDDQFAISYMIRSTDRLNVKGICAAPFLNPKSVSPEDGMEKSYDEIFKVLKLAEREDLNSVVYKGSRTYLQDEETPVESEAADFMANLANEYSPEKPLYIVAIGAITNVASAILKNPAMKENCVIVWLGGDSLEFPNPCREFNMGQDITSGRVIHKCGVPYIQLPAGSVTEQLRTTKYELEYWLKGKNPLADYLAQNTIDEAESYAAGKPWSRVIWDIAGIAWLLNDNDRFMKGRVIRNTIPTYDGYFIVDGGDHFMHYVYHINRDAIYEDLFQKLTE